MKKPTFNFARLDQPASLVPDSIVKEMMKVWAERLTASTASDIIFDFVSDLDRIGESDDPKKLDVAIEAAMDFATRRKLIHNIMSGNWDAYKVEEELPFKAEVDVDPETGQRSVTIIPGN